MTELSHRSLSSRAWTRIRAIGRTRAERALRQRVEAILQHDAPTRPIDSEEQFDRINAEYEPRTGYGYSSLDVWWRGMQRARWLVERVAATEPGARLLEVACGDGMVGVGLRSFGHDVVLTDIEDWRDERARSVPFVAGDASARLPLDDGAFDGAASFNAFIHFRDPAAALREIHRLLRPGGRVFLEFGYLWPSAWGLHAYRTVRMPYAQFLFTEELLARKLGELGFDAWPSALGRPKKGAIPLNGWRLDQYREAWSDGRWKVLDHGTREDATHLDIVERFPDSFRGRELELVDLTTTMLHVVLEKAGP